ncbi:hypothetical protein M5C72_00650 [Companilactobacillus allii]|uniref:sunset domain-containing protein n=1 Tax=Companilactobacillus allii TaxID=1847728 RepID=UPI0009FB2CEC|nr:hypothetical protein [Companilactobacillus allii]USQ68776.1 hypothetical protein M5C72_00650 [Companilactobacillus allii]
MLSKRFKLIITSLVVLLSFTAVGFVANLNDTGISIIQAAQKIKYIGKDKYDIAQEEHKALLAKKKKLTKQVDSTNNQVEDIKNQEAQKEQEEAQRSAQVQPSSSTDTSSDNTRGDMNTSQSGQIVGNKNSHIYHVPGQRGYNMNSSNAVYFQDEQEAINAGYRKAKV